MIYALVIAIDNYPIDHHKLNGCVNDAKSMVSYLEGNYECEQLDIKTYFDEEATRENIISAFQHFQPATKDDTCLLYYSGHGSQAICPVEFKHLSSDGQVETIVCHDSRLEGGYDLIDKELSYLIWEATEKNNPHFVAIFDCCNSGDNTRGMGKTKARMAETARNIPQGRSAHGNAKFNSNTIDGVLQLTPPQGRHVQLAAARPDQLAKELRIGAQTRGAFTYNLIATLEQHNGEISYNQLIVALRAKVKNFVKEQVPQIHAREAEDKHLSFLGKTIAKDKAQRYSVNYDKAQDTWVINAGAIHNWPEDRAKEIRLRVKDNDGQDIDASVTSVGMLESQLGGLDALDKTNAYQAQLDVLPGKLLQLAFAPRTSAAGKKLLKKAIKNSPSPYFEIQDDPKKADYWMRAVDKTIRLTAPEDERPVFRRLDLTEGNAAIFVDDVKKVAHWHHVRLINNPRTTIKTDEYELTLERIIQPGQHIADDDCPAEVVDWKDDPVFNYDYNSDDKTWLHPAFRLKIKNTSSGSNKRKLYFSAVALLSDYTVTNQFLAKEVLAPGKEVYIRDGQFKCIQLGIYDAFINSGISEITEQMKIIISTKEVFTDDLEQKGLTLDDPTVEIGTRMGRGAANVPPQDSWTTEDIFLKVVRPVKEAKIESGASAQVGKMLNVTMPTGVSAMASLNGRPEATRNLSSSTPLPNFPPGWSDQDLDEGLHQTPPANVLELFQVEGMDQINVKNPIRIEIPPMDKDEFLVPVGFDPETGLYFPVGVMEGDSTILIDNLPVPTTSGTRSLGGSIKIFFQKKIGKYLPFVYNHPQLAIVDVVDAGNDAQAAAGLKVEYNLDEAKLKTAVAEADRIVMYIHGIIGDTTEMPKSIQLVKDAMGTSMEGNYDLLLTFDYENLNTSIKDTAQDLKDKLAAIGLGPDHGKTFHIIAHSMGGLVSRWFIEKLDGNQVVNHLYQLGTPNLGSPYGSLYEMVTPLLANAVNGAAFVQPYILPLRVVGKFMDNLFDTLKEMNVDSPFLTELNDSSDPGIPYTIIAGNTQLIKPELVDQQQGLLKKVMARFKTRGHYDALDLMLFKAPNDIAVSTKNITDIPGGDDRQFPPKVIICACDHISYFGDPAGLDSMRQVFLPEASA